jgi:hypothetical protein
MKIMTVFFARKKKYNNLLTVFKKSMRASMPDIKFKLLKIRKPTNIDHKRDTAYSFLAAAYFAQDHKKGVLAVADCDLMFLKSIEDIEKEDFDIAVTVRNKMKYNTGLWFMRPTEKAKKFIARWIINTKILMDNFCKYEDFCSQHGGIDQASLAMTIESNKDIKILELPCLEWNATQSEWRNVNEETRVIHIKSGLRGFCCNPKKNKIDEKYNYLKPLIEKWKGFLNDNT